MDQIKSASSDHFHVENKYSVAPFKSTQLRCCSCILVVCTAWKLCLNRWSQFCTSIHKNGPFKKVQNYCSYYYCKGFTLQYKVPYNNIIELSVYFRAI